MTLQEVRQTIAKKYECSDWEMLMLNLTQPDINKTATILFDEAAELYAKSKAIEKTSEFEKWLCNTSWKEICSKELKTRAYIDTSIYDVYLHGSDFHFTTLIKAHGKTLSELYEQFNKQS